ncbi:hypothetical protein TNCV_2834471 [Trichonephila clavipes]|nr:hypothetical protein TNCV_2834471 [Trichonephila clavipes]
MTKTPWKRKKQRLRHLLDTVSTECQDELCKFDDCEGLLMTGQIAIKGKVLESPLRQKHAKFQGLGLGWPGRQSHKLLVTSR